MARSTSREASEEHERANLLAGGTDQAASQLSSPNSAAQDPMRASGGSAGAHPGRASSSDLPSDGGVDDHVPTFHPASLRFSPGFADNNGGTPEAGGAKGEPGGGGARGAASPPDLIQYSATLSLGSLRSLDDVTSRGGGVASNADGGEPAIERNGSGIGRGAPRAFVSAARAPFHPERLHALLTQHFTLQHAPLAHVSRPAAPAGAAAAQSDATTDGDDANGRDGVAGSQAAVALAKDAAEKLSTAMAALQAHAATPEATVARSAVLVAAYAAEHARALIELAPPGALAAPEATAARSSRGGAKSDSPFAGVLFSEGVAWLGGEPIGGWRVEWQTHGGAARLEAAAPWFAALPEAHWPAEGSPERTRALAAFEPGCGDRCAATSPPIS
jgi:hypothetical protein